VTQDPETRRHDRSTDGLGRIRVDWWATIVAGVLAVLAVLDLLPKIPW
jgi:hypothetical protein